MHFKFETSHFQLKMIRHKLFEPAPAPGSAPGSQQFLPSRDHIHMRQFDNFALIC
jgi:hypothetical protein